MLLAGRVRKPQEEQVIAEILSKHFKRSVSHVELFSIKSNYGQEALQQVRGRTFKSPNISSHVLRQWECDDDDDIACL